MNYIVAFTILGAGIISGLLFAFSNFVMHSLAELSNENGMLAMQKINLKIINPIFMVFFLGTPLLCITNIFNTFPYLESSGYLYIFVGSIVYLLGPFGITMLCNVPLNNKLAKSELSSADTVWVNYQQRWQFWNHIRTYIGIISILLLSLGLGNVE